MTAGYHPGPLLPATLLRRYKRFLADVRLEDGTEVTVHCPNPGRMTTCMPVAGDILLSDQCHRTGRKLRYTWEMSRRETAWVLVNTGHANRLVAAALEARAIPALAGYDGVQHEARCGSSRIDFRLESAHRPPCYVEVKQVTLVRNGVARFPDAVTSRGLRHLDVLDDLRERGSRAVILFLVGRQDANSFRPAHQVDPDYAKALKRVNDAGVEVLVCRAAVGPAWIGLDRRLDYSLEAQPETPFGG